MVSHQALELLAGVLAALIGMMQQAVGLAAAPDRHDEGVGDELGGHASTHRPADHTAREQVDDGRNIEPTLSRPDVGEVGDPLLVRRRRLEGSIEDIRRCHVALPGILGQASPAGPGPQPLLMHQPLDTVQPGIQAFGQNIMPDPTGAIGAVRAGKARTDPSQQDVIVQSPLAGRAVEPGMKTRPRDTERPAYPRYRPDHSVLRNEPELHIESLAK